MARSRTVKGSGDAELRSRDAGGAEIPAGMRAALRAARRGDGRVSPNPLVGAAILTPDGRIRASGHLCFGGPHAEARLLELTGPLPAGAILYVTLEPCAAAGKTPPCVDRVIRAHPSRVVVAAMDPDPRTAGHSVRRMREAGIPVDIGVGEEVALRLALAFHLRHRLNRSLLHLKLAMSADGRLAVRPGQSPARGADRWITGLEARTEVHRERSMSDAVLTGAGTVLTDDPELTVRHLRGPQPSRIVVDSTLRTPPRCRLWKAWADGGGRPERLQPGQRRTGNFRWDPAAGRIVYRRNPRLILATAKGGDRRKLDRFQQIGWEIWELPQDSEKRGVSLKALARKAAAEGFLRILVEAGPVLTGSLFRQDLVDEVSLFIAPLVLGGEAIWPSAEYEASSIGQARSFQVTEVSAFGADTRIRLERRGRIEAVRFTAG